MCVCHVWNEKFISFFLTFFWHLHTNWRELAWIYINPSPINFSSCLVFTIPFSLPFQLPFVIFFKGSIQLYQNIYYRSDTKYQYGGSGSGSLGVLRGVDKQRIEDQGFACNCPSFCIVVVWSFNSSTSTDYSVSWNTSTRLQINIISLFNRLFTLSYNIQHVYSCDWLSQWIQVAYRLLPRNRTYQQVSHCHCPSWQWSHLCVGRQTLSDRSRRRVEETWDGYYVWILGDRR